MIDKYYRTILFAIIYTYFILWCFTHLVTLENFHSIPETRTVAHGDGAIEHLMRPLPHNLLGIDIPLNR